MPVGIVRDAFKAFEGRAQLTPPGIFWFLLIFSAVFFILLLLFLPETCRAVVDDGSIPAPKLNSNISDTIRHRNRAVAKLPVNTAKESELRQNYKLSIPNPLSTMVILLDKEAAPALIATGLAFACFYAISTGASESFKSVYAFNQIQIALMFIPIGVGSVLSAFTTGKLVDWNYRRHAKANNFQIQKNRRQDMTAFPLEKARLEVAMPLFYTAAAGIIAFGWVMNVHTSLAVPIILMFLMGYTLIASFQCLSILMVDIYPGRPATATAANNLIRCELGAASSAAVIPMADAMGWGWAYTTLALIFLAGTPTLWVIMRYGMQWRVEKKAKLDAAEDKKREQTERFVETEVMER